MSASVQLLVRALCHAEGGVLYFDVYRDEVELVGGPGDSDASAVKVHGEFDPDEIRRTFPNMPVYDERRR